VPNGRRWSCLDEIGADVLIVLSWRTMGLNHAETNAKVVRMVVGCPAATSREENRQARTVSAAIPLETRSAASVVRCRCLGRRAPGYPQRFLYPDALVRDKNPLGPCGGCQSARPTLAA